MALLNILNYPDKRLHTVAKPVRVVDERIRKLVADMTETMYEAPGVGLAATQVDVPCWIFACTLQHITTTYGNREEGVER